MSCCGVKLPGGMYSNKGTICRFTYKHFDENICSYTHIHYIKTIDISVTPTSISANVEKLRRIERKTLREIYGPQHTIPPLTHIVLEPMPTSESCIMLVILFTTYDNRYEKNFYEINVFCK